MGTDTTDKKIQPQTEYLCNVEYITSDSDGNIFFKGHLAEQFDFPFEHQEVLQPRLVKVQQRCLKMEKLGLPINVTNYLDHTLWQHITTPYDPFLFFIDQYKTIHQKDRSIMFYYDETDQGEKTLFHYKIIDLDTGNTITDHILTSQYFHEFAKEGGYQKVSFDGDSLVIHVKWLCWMEENDFKLWYLNDDAYAKFLLKSMENGICTEVPKTTFDAFKSSHPILTHNYLHYHELWMLSTEITLHSESTYTLKAFRTEGTQYMATNVNITINLYEKLKAGS